LTLEKIHHNVEKAGERKGNRTLRVEEKTRSFAEERGVTRRKRGFVTKNSVLLRALRGEFLNYTHMRSLPALSFETASVFHQQLRGDRYGSEILEGEPPAASGEPEGVRPRNGENAGGASFWPFLQPLPLKKSLSE
jgi:hypothetical protein